MNAGGGKDRRERLKGGTRRFWEWWVCSVSWLRWWFQGCMHMSKHTKMHTFNMCSLLYISHTSIKLLNKQTSKAWCSEEGACFLPVACSTGSESHTWEQLLLFLGAEEAKGRAKKKWLVKDQMVCVTSSAVLPRSHMLGTTQIWSVSKKQGFLSCPSYLRRSIT